MAPKRKISVSWAAGICALSLISMLISLIFTGEKQPEVAFVPPEFDKEAVIGTPDVPDGLGWSEVDAQVFKASICGVVTVENDKADIWFANPTSNTVWLKLRILDANGNALGETGLIKPGEYVKSVAFSVVPKIGEPIGLKLMAYEPETYYSAGSATLNTIIAGGDT